MSGMLSRVHAEATPGGPFGDPGRWPSYLCFTNGSLGKEEIIQREAGVVQEVKFMLPAPMMGALRDKV